MFKLNDILTRRTPFYYYDRALLRDTLDEVKRQTQGLPAVIHYALKANANPEILREIVAAGMGADLVSGGEIKAAIKAGFDPQMMAFAGVGKTDWEIRLALQEGVGCFNIESVPELEVINQIAMEMDKTAPVTLRVNPDIDPHTHQYITTGTAHNKFGIALEDLPTLIERAKSMTHIHLRGLHFHIGSQITRLQPYVMLCEKINELQQQFDSAGIKFEIINVGGGLGIDYRNPDAHPMADFEQYFGIFEQHLKLSQGQQVHFELGRAIVAQCGTLFSRVLYVKHNRDKSFVIIDAGMNDLVRPALYQAHHRVDNITSVSHETDIYDVVGPVCESSDTFAHDCTLPITQRGDLIAIRSVGAYGESMASTYNLRPLPQALVSTN